jgi:hypothetical protein
MTPFALVGTLNVFKIHSRGGSWWCFQLSVALVAVSSTRAESLGTLTGGSTERCSNNNTLEPASCV